MIRDRDSLCHDGFTISLRRNGSNGRNGVRKDGLLMWQVRMRMWQVRMRSFQKKWSIRVRSVHKMTTKKQHAALEQEKKKYVRTADAAGDLRRHMDKSARLANI